MKDIYTKEEKIMLAAAKRRQFNNLKKTIEFKKWKRRQYNKVQNRKCAYCQKKIHYNKLHIDHVFPLFEGGKNDFDNFVLSCPKCNIRKWVFTPGKPLWIARRENQLAVNDRLKSIRQEQKDLALHILDEQTLTNLDWI